MTEDEATLKRRQLAVLLAVYSLSGGKPGVPCHVEAIRSEIARLGLWGMSDAELDAARAAIVADAQASRTQS